MATLLELRARRLSLFFPLGFNEDSKELLSYSWTSNLRKEDSCNDPKWLVLL
jgi:hypothetical protein